MFSSERENREQANSKNATGEFLFETTALPTHLSFEMHNVYKKKKKWDGKYQQGS